MRRTAAPLKQLVAHLPPRFLATTAWLKHHGISRQRAHAYAKRGWLEHVSHGLYRRPSVAGTPPPRSDWIVPVLSAQWIMEHELHVGATTALFLAGYRHDLPLGERDVVYLYGDHVPTWLTRLELRTELRIRSRRLFADSETGLEHVTPISTDSPAPAVGEWPLIASSPERAILEAIDELPDDETFQSIDRIFEGLTDLRPKRMAELLQSCRSVQTKRLFFVFADKHGHAWRSYVDPGEFDLGSGDRAFARNGRLHPIYRITVPSDLLPWKEEDTRGP